MPRSLSASRLGGDALLRGVNVSRPWRVALLSAAVICSAACHSSDSCGRVASTTGGNSLGTFRLVLLNHDPLPAHEPDADTAGDCEWVDYAMSYELGADRWWHTRDFSTTCSRVGGTLGARRVERDSGSLHHRGDTLVFMWFNPGVGDTLEVKRAFLRGDTLDAGFEGFDWPPELYIRQRRYCLGLVTRASQLHSGPFL